MKIFLYAHALAQTRVCSHTGAHTQARAHTRTHTHPMKAEEEAQEW